MSETQVKNLLVSFTKLEHTIDQTYSVLRSKSGVPFYVLQHVQQYRDVVAKQRGLALDLEHSLAQKNWQEVSRLVKLINALSSMIQDDAKALMMDDEPGVVGSSSLTM